MATPWGDKWQLNADHAIMGDSGVSLFRFKEKRVSGLKLYTVDFKNGEMKDMWRDCILVQRGSKPMGWRGAPLPAWVRDAHGNFPARKYRERIDENLEYTTASTLRLEGEVRSGDAYSWVMFLLARGALRDAQGKPADLLIVQHDDKFEWSKPEYCGPIEDGTGHGNSP